MTKKLHNPKAHAPAVYIPCWLIQVPNKLLSHAAKMLYGRLAQWSNTKGKVYRSVPQLAKEIGTERRQVDRYIKELKDAGLIGTFHPQKGGVNHFEFYDHSWMYEPINEQLSYEEDPTTNMTLGHDKNDVTPTTNMSSINRKKIKTNKNKHKNISASGEATDFDYTEPDEQQGEKQKSDLKANQTENEKNDSQVIEGEREPTRSDYYCNQTNNSTISKLSITYGLKNIQQENIFSIPDQMLQDWIANRKKKRAAITQTAWARINKELAKCKEQGIDPVKAFEKMVAHGWQALDADWFSKEKTSSSGSQWDVDSVMRA